MSGGLWRLPGRARESLESTLPRKPVLDSATLFAGQVTSSLIGILALAILARWLGPESYGIYANALAFAGFFGLLADAGINQLIIRENVKDPTQASNRYRAAQRLRIFLVITATASCMLSAFLGYPPSLAVPIAIASLAIVFGGIGSLYSTFFNIEGRFAQLSVLRVVERGFGAIALLTAVALWRTPEAAALGSVVGSLLGSATFVVAGRRLRRIAVVPRDPLEWAMLRASLWFGATALATFLIGRASILLASRTLGAESLGEYSVAYNLVDQSLLLVASMMTAFFPSVVTRVRDGTISGQSVAKATLLLGGIGIAITVVAQALAPMVIPLLLGGRFSRSLSAFLILLWMFPIALATVPTSLLADSTNQQYIHLVNGAYMALTMVVLFVVLAPTRGAEGAAMAVVGSRLVGAVLGIPLILGVCARYGGVRWKASA